MERIDLDPSADDDQAVTNTKKHFGHGLLSPGENLVVSLADEGGHLGKGGDFKGLAMYPRASLVISYHELERVFNEQHAEWIEL